MTAKTTKTTDATASGVELLTLALHRLAAAGGRTPDVPLLVPLEHLAALDLDAPELADLLPDLDAITDAFERLDSLRHLEHRFDADDLAADDYAERFQRAALADALRDRGAALVEPLRRELTDRATAVAKRARPAIHAALDGFYRDHAEEYHHHDDLTYSGAERERRAELRRHVEAAWYWLLDQPGDAWVVSKAPGGYQMPVAPYAGNVGEQWCLDFEWTPAAWENLADVTAPGMVPGGNVYDVATRCGATPRLAPSYAHAVRDHMALRNPEHTFTIVNGTDAWVAVAISQAAKAARRTR